MVLVHGFTDTWRTWELVLPALEREHEVLAVTLTGHSGGPSIEGELSTTTVVEGVEAAMDEAGFERAHIVGNSLGGWVTLQLASRGRAKSAVALAPAGGWAEGDDFSETLEFFKTMQELLVAAAPHAEALLATPEGRRQATEFSVVNYEHIPPELLAHQLRGAASTPGFAEMIDLSLREGWSLEAENIDCPVRIVWGTADRILEYPRTARRYREDWLPNADWVELDGIGHMPQLDVPTETTELILGFTRG